MTQELKLTAEDFWKIEMSELKIKQMIVHLAKTRGNLGRNPDSSSNYRTTEYESETPNKSVVTHESIVERVRIAA
jgi:hypothetical protein